MDVKYRVEEGVKMPSKRKDHYPWGELEVGDSFFVPEKTSGGMAASAVNAGKKHNMTFRCRSEDGGVRVWRIENEVDTE